METSPVTLIIALSLTYLTGCEGEPSRFEIARKIEKVEPRTLQVLQFLPASHNQGQGFPIFDSGFPLSFTVGEIDDPECLVLVAQLNRQQ